MRFFKKEAETVGLIGTGLQGMHQLLVAVSSTSVKTIYVFDRWPEKMEKFIQEFRTIR